MVWWKKAEPAPRTRAEIDNITAQLVLKARIVELEAKLLQSEKELTQARITLDLFQTNNNPNANLMRLNSLQSVNGWNGVIVLGWRFGSKLGSDGSVFCHNTMTVQLAEAILKRGRALIIANGVYEYPTDFAS